MSRGIPGPRAGVEGWQGRQSQGGAAAQQAAGVWCHALPGAVAGPHKPSPKLIKMLTRAVINP